MPSLLTEKNDTTKDLSETCRTKAKRTRNTNEKKRTKSFAFVSAVLHVICGFALGCTKFPCGIYPCGTALVFAAGKNCFFAYLGASLSCAFYPYGIAPAFAVNTIAFFARALLSSYDFNEKNGRKLFLSSLLSVLCGVVTATIGVFEREYVLTALFYAACLPAVTYALCTLFSLPKSKGVTVNGSFCAVCFIAVFAASYINIPFFSFAVFFSVLVTLFSALRSDSVHGLLVGLISGIACTGMSFDARLAFPMSIAGFAAGMCDRRKKGQAVFCFCFVFSVICSLFLTEDIGRCFSGAFAGSVAFLPLYGVLPRIFENRRPLFPSAFKNNAKYEKLSHAFSSISDMVYNVSDKLKYPSEQEIREQVRKIYNSSCAACSMYENCYSRKLYDSENAEDIICDRLLSGGLKKSDLPEKYADSCIKLSEIVEKLNDGYSRLINDHFRDNKTEILASEYSSMARLIKYTSQKEKTDMTPDPILEEKARCALAAIGVRFSSVSAYGKRSKIIDVNGVIIDRFPCTSRELSEYLSEKCGYFFGEPEYIGHGDEMIMRIKRARKIKLEFARCACAKGGCGVNGDSVNFFESDEDYFYALISDGMGSGRSAALTSRLTSIFLEKLLTTGTHKNVTLEMLNNLLLSKNDESFATVDLLEIDLLSGDASFIKAGAAPAYILRASKLYKIASFTPPAGIVRSFCAESTKFVLEKGDTVLMLSDGIVQSSDDAPWLCEMLSQDVGDDPSRLCDRILSKAKKINLREDDMTCAAVRVV